MKLTARKVLGAFCALALSAGGASTAWAAAPAAGSLIGNQATASYNDGGGNPFTATSNVVTSTVQQVAALTLTSSQTKSATQGQFVYFPHTLTNKGNGLDTFNLSTVNNSSGALDNAKIYIDNNANGSVDVGDTEVTSVQLAAGAQTALIVQTRAATGAGGNIVLTATSAHTTAQTASNTDTVTVTTGAVINVQKGISVTSGGPGTEITYTLTYQNTGNATATNVILADQIPASLAYVDGSGKGNTTQTLTDADDTESNPSGITYKQAAGRIDATIASVPAGGTGTIQFKVTVKPGVAAGVINNTGYFCAVGAAGCTAGTVLTGGSPTNTVPFTVVQAAGVVFNGVEATTGPADGEPVTVAAANQGATVTFEDWVHNTGNALDKFNITIDSSSFPTGTSFQILKSDGATPLLDTSNDGVIDTGDLASGGAYKVVVKAVLPGTASGNNGGAGYTVTLKATSVADSGKFESVPNKLTTITPTTVDLTNGDKAGGADIGAGATGTAVITSKNANAGTAANFPLWVYGGAVADTYNLSAVVSATGDAASKFSVVFYEDASTSHNGTVLGAQVSDTGNIAPNGLKYFVAVVTSQAGTAAGATANVDITVTGASTGATDKKRDQVVVNASHAISLNPDNVQQAFPGGNVTYTHTLTNNGNATEAIVLSKNDSGALSSVIYLDLNGDGTLGTGDAVYDSANPAHVAWLTLLKGEEKKIFVTVAVPANTPVGTSSLTTVTASNAPTSPTATDSATDTTSVVGGFINLAKTGKNDVGCNGTVTSNAAQVKPGECIEYTVVATNIGSYPAQGVVINDVVPAYTSYQSSPASACTGSTGVASCNVTAAGGNVSTSAVDLQSGQSVTLKFTVQVSPLDP